MQSCSEAEQAVHGLLPSHLAVEHDQHPVPAESSPQPRQASSRACSNESNLILRARQTSHCQKGVSTLVSLCKAERHEKYRGGSSRHGMSSVSSWQGVQTVQTTAQSPCHHPSTRPGMSGQSKDRTGHATSCWAKYFDRWCDSLSVCITCLLQDSNLGLGGAQQPRIDPRRTGRHRRCEAETKTHSRSSHVRDWVGDARCGCRRGRQSRRASIEGLESGTWDLGPG